MLQLTPQDVQGPSFVAFAIGSKKTRSSEVQGELSPLEFLLMRKIWHKKPLTRLRSSVLCLRSEKKRENSRLFRFGQDGY